MADQQYEHFRLPRLVTARLQIHGLIYLVTIVDARELPSGRQYLAQYTDAEGLVYHSSWEYEGNFPFQEDLLHYWNAGGQLNWAESAIGLNNEAAGQSADAEMADADQGNVDVQSWLDALEDADDQEQVPGANAHSDYSSETSTGDDSEDGTGETTASDDHPRVDNGAKSCPPSNNTTSGSDLSGLSVATNAAIDAAIDAAVDATIDETVDAAVDAIVDTVVDEAVRVADDSVKAAVVAGPKFDDGLLEWAR